MQECSNKKENEQSGKSINDTEISKETKMEEHNNESNELLVTSAKVEGEEVLVHSKDVDGKKEVVKIEFPESRKDDTEWQDKAKNSISIAAKTNQLNLQNKKLAVELEQKTNDLKNATKTLSDMGSKPSGDLKLDLEAGIMKELNLKTPEELAEADRSDITRASRKVTEAYQEAVIKSTKGSAMTTVMIDTIVNENEPGKVNEFIQYVKSLGVSPTMQIYSTWKSTQVKHSTKQDVTFNSIAGLQVDHVPFVAVGESHANMSGTQKIEKDTAEIMLGGLDQV